MSTAASLIGRDGDAMARVANGEEALFERVVHRYHRPVVKFIYRMVGDYDAALDLAQDVFLKVYNALDQYDEKYRFSTWLFRIASNHAIDFLRKQCGNLCSLDQPDGQSDSNRLEIISDEPSPERQFILNQRRTIIESVIAGLPIPYRQVIVLRHVAELGYEEIAEVTGLPLGTVKNRIFRAREAIRTALVSLGVESIE